MYRAYGKMHLPHYWYTSFSQLFRAAEAANPNLTQQQFMNAVQRTTMYSYYTANPYVQNTRVKNISSKPKLLQKDEIVKCLLSPNTSELELRQVSDALVWTAYPYYKLIKTTADILTYRHYTPAIFSMVMSDFLSAFITAA